MIQLEIQQRSLGLDQIEEIGFSRPVRALQAVQRLPRPGKERFAIEADLSLRIPQVEKRSLQARLQFPLQTFPPRHAACVNRASLPPRRRVSLAPNRQTDRG